jgi:HAD superfamily phosphatase
VNSKPVIAFDMDGVLADVRDSYLATIAATVEHFTGTAVSLATIEEYKEHSGWNNDWELAHELIRNSGAIHVAYQEVVDVFQRLFLGQNFDGLIAREKWIPRQGVLEGFALTNRLAIFSGRPRDEIDYSLRRFAPRVEWACIVADEDVSKPKPSPDGLQIMTEKIGLVPLTYVGDSIDDARSAGAAGVPFIGIARPDQSALRQTLYSEGAKAVVENVNQLEEAL